VEVNEALGKWAASQAAAYQQLAEDLQSQPDMAIGDDGVPERLGSRQTLVYQILARATDDGLPTSQVAAEMQYEVPNTYLTLQSLARSGLVELIPGSKPQRWRLHPKQRGSAGPYLLAAQQVRHGEWATYGDLSIAIRGDDQGARAVGRAAATLPDFPNPHRILKAGGSIPSDWHSDDGGGPEECRRRLEEEGVMFDEGGRALAQHRVGWEEIRSRLRRAGVAVPPGPGPDA
jgi:alkylated DNA nucleotide flippase Atl1